VFELACCQRHWRVLDLSADTGLFTWEALRRAGEGGVWALVADARAAAALSEPAAALPELRRPSVLTGPVEDLPQLLPHAPGEELRFDLIVGRNVLWRIPARATALAAMAACLAPGGRLILAESVPRHTQRLCALLPEAALPADLTARLAAAEEALYANPADPMVNWDIADLTGWFEERGLRLRATREQEARLQVPVTPALLQRWFGEPPPGARPSYAQHLARRLTADEVRQVYEAFRTHLAGKSLPWRSRAAIIAAERLQS